MDEVSPGGSPLSSPPGFGMGAPNRGEGAPPRAGGHACVERGFKVSLAESGVGCNLGLCWDAGGVELGKCVVFALVTLRWPFRGFVGLGLRN